MTAVFIANRGEIALRIVRTCRDLGLRSIVGYSAADLLTPAVRLADTSVCSGDAPARASYLNIESIIRAATSSGATMVHPGCGFLAENADFAEAVAQAGLIFIGPTPAAMRDLGDKRKARELADRAGLPIVPGVVLKNEKLPSASDLKRIGLPLLVKAAHGGGGRGMRIVRTLNDLEEATTQARRESSAAFGKDDVFIESLVEHARHVEVQVFGDSHGNVVDFGTRDCTIQRRHQKLIEEAPAPFLSRDVTERIRDSARRLAEHVGYVNAGTAEFLVNPVTGEFFFLEMNTRLQVEHSITEMIYGIDLVALQIRVAQGESLGIEQRDITPRGHAIEIRVNAENPHDDFRPQSGVVRQLSTPQGPGIRCDFGFESGSDISPHYDSLLGKIIAHAPTREAAIAVMARAIQELVVDGLPTTAHFTKAVMKHVRFQEGNHWTTMVDEGIIDLTEVAQWNESDSAGVISPQHQPATTTQVQSMTIQTTTGPLSLFVAVSSHATTASAVEGAAMTSTASASRATQTTGPIAPMAGSLLRYTVKVGDVVAADTTIAFIESMKMETAISAGIAGTVKQLLVEVGAAVKRGSVLAIIES